MDTLSLHSFLEASRARRKLFIFSVTLTPSTQHLNSTLSILGIASPPNFTMGKNSTLRSTKYQPVEREALEKEETVSFLDQGHEFQCPYHHQHGSIANLPWMWIASTVFFMLLSLTLTTKNLRISRSFETGFTTDLGLS